MAKRIILIFIFGIYSFLGLTQVMDTICVGDSKSYPNFLHPCCSNVTISTSPTTGVSSSTSTSGTTLTFNQAGTYNIYRNYSNCQLLDPSCNFLPSQLIEKVTVYAKPPAPNVLTSGKFLCTGEPFSITFNPPNTLSIYPYKVYNSSGTHIGNVPTTIYPIGSNISVAYTIEGEHYAYAGCKSPTVTVGVSLFDANPFMIGAYINASSTIVCNDDSVKLSLEGSSISSSNYSNIIWYENSCLGTVIGSGKTINVKPSTATDYYVAYRILKGSILNGYCYSKCEKITIHPPNIDMGHTNTSTITACEGEIIALSHTAGFAPSNSDFKWYKNGCGVGTPIATGRNLSITTTVNEKYYVRIENGSCTTACREFDINVPLQVNNAIITPKRDTICEGGNITINVTNNSNSSSTNWKWYKDICCNSNIGTGSSINVSPTETTKYYFRGEIPSNCNTDTLVSTIVVPIVANNVVLNVTKDTICKGETTTLSFGGTFYPNTASYWKWYEGGSCGNTLVDSGFSINVSPNQTTTYYLRGEKDGCNSVCKSITVHVIEEPKINTIKTVPSSFTGELCIGDSLRINANYQNGGGTVSNIQWTFQSCTGTIISNTHSIGVKPNSDTTYYFSVSNECFTVCDSLEVAVIDILDSIVLNIPDSICQQGDSIDLYSWIGNDVTSGEWKVNNQLVPNGKMPSTLTGIVYLTYSFGVNTSCAKSKTDSVYIIPSPTINAIATAELYCAYDTINLLPPSSNKYFIYSDTTVSSLIDSLPYKYVLNGSSEKIYVRTKNNNCYNRSGFDTLKLNAIPHKKINFLDTTICILDSIEVILDSADKYEWNTGDTTQGIKISPNDNLGVTVWRTFDSLGCKYYDSVNILVINDTNVIANLDSINIYPINNNTWQIEILVNDIVNYPDIRIIDVKSGNDAIIQNNKIQYTTTIGAMPDTIQYVLCSEFCSNYCDTTLVFVNVTNKDLFIPSGLSITNRDGKNDTFIIRGLDLSSQNRLSVFNQWGDEVFYSNNYQNDWDGTYNGENLPPSTYYYVLTLSTNQKYTGYILIK